MGKLSYHQQSSFSLFLHSQQVSLEGLLAPPRGSQDVLLHRVEAGEQPEALLFPHEVVADHVVLVCKGSFKRTEVKCPAALAKQEEFILTVKRHGGHFQKLLRMLRILIAED